MRKLLKECREDAAAVLNAMANPWRLQILKLILKQEMSVNTLSAAIGLGQSNTSQHLAKMKRAGIVEARREAQTIFYSSNSRAVATMIAALDQISRDQGIP